jgi:hypothetical protein
VDDRGIELQMVLSCEGAGDCLRGDPTGAARMTERFAN